MASSSRHIERYGVFFFSLCVAVAAWQCFILALDTQLGGVGRLFHEWHLVAISVANALCLLCPYWLLKRRWRWTVWIPMTLLMLWCVMQMCYCRAYDDLMPWQSLAMTDNVNSVLVSSTLALLRWQDLLVITPFFMLMAACALGKRVEAPHDGCSLKWFSITMVTCLVIGSIGYLNGTENYKKRFLYNFSNREYFAQNGLLPYGLFSLYQSLFNSHTLSDAEIAQMRRFINDECPHYIDNAYSSMAQRNLVLIIVESLHSWPIGMEVDGREVTPALNRLVASDSVIYVPHVLFQTSHGHSSDAHFIYNTGLLPLRDGVVAVNFGDADYPSLAKAFKGYDCRMVVCDDKTYWNQTVTSRSYGFDKLYSREHLLADSALARHNGVDDAALTDFAATLLPQLRQPFFVEMVTMTMHTPYTPGKVRDSWITASDTLNAEAREYLNCVNVTDSCIGAFIDQLRHLDLAQNTIVAIVSDHTQLYLNRIKGISDYDALPDDWGIPLIVTGCDTTLRYEPVIGQIDVFPTLLDVMGANSYPWKGLGHSFLRYPVKSAIQPRNMTVLGDSTDLTPHQRQAWDISRLIIFNHGLSN